MADKDDFQMVIKTDDGAVQVVISRSALAKLSGRSHVTPEEIASAYKIEIEDIVRDKLQGRAPAGLIRLSESDF
jgi:hypothetical protein